MNKGSLKNLENKIILSKKNYFDLIKIKEKLEKILITEEGKFSVISLDDTKKKKGSFEKAFGILKNSFGKNSSLSYITKLRKIWRE